MVMYYGLGTEIGNLSFFDSTGKNEQSFQKPYSEETAQLIDKEVRGLVEVAYDRTKKIIVKHKKKLIELAELLLEKEVINKKELIKIFGVRKQTKSSENVKDEMISKPIMIEEENPKIIAAKDGLKTKPESDQREKKEAEDKESLDPSRP